MKLISTEIEVFNSHMENILSIIKIENKLNYITGDFNIDLLKTDTHAPSSAFLELLYSYGYLPLINKPTRVTNSSATIIDHIYCNKIMDQATFQDIFYTDISDHYTVFSVSIGSDRMESTSYEHRRAYNEHNFDVFCDKSVI